MKKNVPLPDFLFVVGDSREDEYVFNWAHKQKGIRDVVTVTLGARNTEASATLTQGVTGTYEFSIPFFNAKFSNYDDKTTDYFPGVLSTLQRLAAL